jgi:SAM-dependent methyltransferase
MEAATLAIEAEVEESHWWFTGRRRLFSRELTFSGLTSQSMVLDVGTGTGANLRMLHDVGVQRVTGLDCDELSIRFCRSKGLGNVELGDICAMPFADGRFDFVIATDVIEHVDDDVAALREVARVLNDNGKALIAVPAFSSLWGLQDVVAHHKRRYRLRPLLRKMREAGLDPIRSYYFNYLLFAPIWLARRLISLFGITRNSENEFNSPLLNQMLSIIFAIDTHTAPVLRPPFGVSILAIAQKRRSHD